jgi:hypothetical protein
MVHYDISVISNYEKAIPSPIRLPSAHRPGNIEYSSDPHFRGNFALTARKSWTLGLFLLAAIAAAMIWPIFKTEYYEIWPAIDATFIAGRRFLAENLPHPGWQPIRDDVNPSSPSALASWSAPTRGRT